MTVYVRGLVSSLHLLGFTYFKFICPAITGITWIVFHFLPQRQKYLGWMPTSEQAPFFHWKCKIFLFCASQHIAQNLYLLSLLSCVTALPNIINIWPNLLDKMGNKGYIVLVHKQPNTQLTVPLCSGRYTLPTLILGFSRAEFGEFLPGGMGCRKGG